MEGKKKERKKERKKEGKKERDRGTDKNRDRHINTWHINIKTTIIMHNA